MKADYEISSSWGDMVEWTHSAVEQLQSAKLDEKTILEVYGFKQKIPEVGDTLMGEFEKSFMKFEFVEVRRCGDPADMFFAEVKIIEQEMKA
ncbi:hypothetical protein THIOSC15_10006 [uncultured Thiomicrorhabdus sp.]